jgi:gluconate 2-dehydrogenase gamma chain
MTADWPGLHDALAHAAAVRRGDVPARFDVFTAAEAADIAAIAARFVPTTDTPGATEAGVIHFIDRTFRTDAAPELADFRTGLAAVRERVIAQRPGVTRFALLPVTDQDAVLAELEAKQVPIFGWMRFLVMVGMFADPRYGGNRGELGWKLIGFENRMAHTPPFGHYDAEAARGNY